MLIPESLHRSQRLAQERLSSSPGSLEEHCREVGERGFGYNLRHLIEVKPEECAPDAPIEVCLKQGEMMIFDPMMLHSESVVTTPESRYVLFQNFFDIAAADQALPMRGSSAPAVKFPPVFRDALPENRRSLLGKQSRFCASEHTVPAWNAKYGRADWEYPGPDEAVSMALAGSFATAAL